MTETEKYVSEICNLTVYKAIFSNKASSDCKYQKTVIRKMDDSSYQAESFTDKQAFHKNFSSKELYAEILSVFPGQFRQAEIFTDNYIYSAKISKKGKLLNSRRKNDTVKEKDASHNRKKKYIIDSENLPPVFCELGISGADGRIISSKYDKFRQICRFTEQINDVLSKDTKDELRIIDFGCGKSYLTFVLYFYITEILHKKARITGLDLKEDVINKCKALAEKYGYTGLEFLCMDIKDYVPDEEIDMVITLHACDIATDYALFFACRSKAKYIFSVPCCQKEARSMVKTKDLSIITDYGLINERFCSLATDALRGKLLELSGYSVDICEFIDFENSPKNMLIRAKKHPSADKYKLAKIKAQIESMKTQFGISITLEKLLFENGL